MPKKTSLASALSGAAKNRPAPKEQIVEPVKEKTVREQVVVVNKLPVPPSRVGKKAVTGYIEPEAQKQLKQIALEEDTTVQELFREAINDLFVKKGRTPLA
ncbi:MAG: hypothetical protein OEY58_19655 [Gammaproteobacteria bacterium]|nr:hypothetical protein [Gammaproteobacteria bacterium]